MPRYIYKSEIFNDLPDARVVNTFKGKPLGNIYYVFNNKLYKQMKDKKYREICPQHNKNDEYKFFFVKNKDGGKSRVGINKLQDLTLVFTTDEPVVSEVSE
jgi:hypothetical protein